MLEGLISTIMNRFLGMYIKNFDSTQLNVAIWSGDVRLKNLELKKEALDQMKLPLNVSEGHLGQLTLQIPWSNLKGRPVKVLIEDVFLLAAPRSDQEYNEEEEEQRRQTLKLEKLQNAELLQEKSTAGMSQEEEKKNQSFAASLTTKILDNLQITVKNIHIRYEDAISTEGHPFSLGFTLEEFSAISTNERWEPDFIQGHVEISHKLARLSGLAVYWNTDSEHFSSKSHDEIVQTFRKLAGKEQSATENHQFVLKPVNGIGRIEMNKTRNNDRPRIKSQLLFDEIGFVLDEDQYRDLLMMVDLFHFYIRHQQYKKYQPKGVTPKEDPRAWLKFATDAVLSQIHERNRKWSWAYFAERRDDRKRYIELFKKQKRQEHLTPDETRDIQKLEHKLSYEDLRFYRSLARNQLRKEHALVPKKPEEKQAQGWGSYLASWVSTQKPEEDDTVMTDQQRKELYEAIDWDEHKALTEAIDLPRETVKMEVQASLKTGSFTLKRDPHGRNNEILSLLFDTFKARLLQRPDSVFGELSLGGLRLYDGTTEGTLYPQIIRVKNSPPTAEAEDSRIKELGNEDEELEDVQNETDPNNPFFRASFEQNPLDESADSAVTVKMRSMEIIYNPKFVEEIYRFFKPPERHMESIGALMESAGATVEGLRQQTRAGLEFALEEHKTVNAKLDLQAPLIIIPESCTEKNTNCLILDAGHVAVTSDLVKRADIGEIQAKQNHKYSEEDWKQLESLMYDKFRLTLESTQVLIGPSIEETVAQLHQDSDQKHLHIVDRINIDFILEISILPKAPNLTKFKMTGHLPVLQAAMSDKKYKALMRIIDVAIPDLDDDELPKIQKEPIKEPVKKEQGTYADLRRASAFQFSAQQQELLLAEDTDDDEDGEDKFEEASDGISPSFHQKTFEFKFTVDRLQGSLFRADPDGVNPDKELVSLVAEHFELEVNIRPYDLSAEVILKSLNVEDLVDEDPSPDFKKIVTSDGLTKSSESPLFFVKYVQVKKESPEFMTVYDAIDKHIDVQISTIDVVVTRKTVLTLLDFIITTFANPDAPKPPPQKAIEGSGEPDAEEALQVQALEQEQKIRVKVDLDSIALILNNDGIRLATLSLASAELGIFVMGKTIRVGGRLGKFSLIDDINEGADEESPFRKLVSIQGDELAEFRYETFDPEAKGSYPGYNSSIFLRSGSIKVNFVEEPFRKIIDFTVKFGRMQALFNAARQAAMDQASQIQAPDKIHFDIVARTPIVVFPRVGSTESQGDLITVYLGELYAQNSFVPLGDSENSIIGNKISAGIRKTRLTSEFHYGDQLEELELLDKLDLTFAMTYLEHVENSKRPDIEIEGSMSDLNLKLTQNQYKFLLELSRAIPGVFAGDAEDEDQIVEQLPKETAEPAKSVVDFQDGAPDSGKVVHLNPELGTGPDTWTKVDLVFKVGSIGMELYACEPDQAITDLEEASLSRASLNNTNVKLRMISDGSLESEILIESFNIRDSRRQETNKFRKIMSSTHKEGSQFMASVTLSGGAERNLVALLTIDSPRVIFALDYIFALRDYVMSGLQSEEEMISELEEDTESDEDSNKSDRQTSLATSKQSQSTALSAPSKQGEKRDQGINVSFRANIVDAQVILIANPGINNSEAIVLGTKQILLSQQHALTLQVEKVGMFLCRMDKPDTTKLRILDDFTLKVAMDSRNIGPNSSLQSINVDVEPLVLRVSLRDILLAVQIFNKASEMSGAGQGKKPIDEEPTKIKDLKGDGSLKRRTASGHGVSTRVGKSKSLATGRSTSSKKSTSGISSSMVKREELKAEIEGMRVILIGDQHELPLLDLSVKKFTARVKDWSGDMDADTSIETFVNIYNFSKSAWEPLIEPWQLGFHMAKTTQPEKLSIDLYSRKNLEVTITSQTIALITKAAQFMQQDEDMLTKPRGSEAPYRIHNQTGYPLHVWAASEDSPGGSSMAIKLQDGETAPWRFEEWEKMRESLAPEGVSGIVGVKLEDSPFESIKEISVNREGEQLYTLRPMKNDVLHRLLCEVRLGTDNVKYITFRSPFLIENNTQIPVEMGILDPQRTHLIKVYKIVPGESQPAPVEAAYHQAVVIRPDAGFGYTWSRERLFWRDLLKGPTKGITCRTEEENAPPFYFQMHAKSQKKGAAASSYPHMKVRLSAPVEVENLLPYDFKFRIYDKNNQKEWTNFLRKGGLSPVHVVDLSHLLLMSIEMQDTPYGESDFAIINSNDAEFDAETMLITKDNQGLELKLKLHYYQIPDSGGAFRVSIYSPYIILNKTGLNMMVKSKSLLQSAKVAAGQVQTGSTTTHKAHPYMFSYPNHEQQNRAVFKVGDSNWSRPLSFEAVGSVSDVVLPSSTKQTEIHIGITVDEGEGKYKMTKVVTLSPRFILKSKLSETVQIREPGTGSNNIMTLEPGQLLPLHFLRSTHHKQLTLLFPGINNRWSAPFNISDLGSVHIKMHKHNQRQTLIRVDILAEKATVFLHLNLETKHWPFSIRNESTQEFTFWQSDPNHDDTDDGESDFRPIQYKLPPRSIMPYAWDYPAAKTKELVLCAGNKRQLRHIPLTEIGNLLPIKVESIGPDGQPQRKIIDVNVIAKGPTQTLVLSNYKQSKSIYKVKSHTSAASTNASTSSFEVKDVDSGVAFQAQIRFAGIGISLINRQLKELAYITFRDLEFKYGTSSLYQTYSLIIKWVQIDNQLYGGIFPIILYPSVVPKTGKEMDVHPSIHASATLVNDESYGVTYIKYATFLMQQMTIEIDEDFIYALLDFSKIPGISSTERDEGKLCDDSLDIPEPKILDAGRDLYFELLNIQPAQIDLSLLRTDVVNVEDKTSSNNPLMFLLNILTMAIGNVNDAPIKLNALMLENARVSVPVLLQRLQAHYTQEVLYQIHKILGSADFLGNPVGLFNNISSGVVDIFYEPYQGFIMTDRPQELGIGIAKGATMFVKKSVFGVSDSLSKFTGSISKGLAAATLDKQFQDRRRMSRSRNRPKHALYGVTTGANSFVSSLASGVGGLARKPLEGAEREGAWGLFKGIGKGVVGLATKPAIGVFDLASNVTEGIRNTTTVFDQDGLDRVRLTRFIGQDGVVRPYNQREALGQFWLKQLDNGKYFNEEYIAHLELPEQDVVVMLTYTRIMLVKSKKLNCEWDVPLKELQTISMERTGIVLVLRGGRQGPFIPTKDEGSRKFLFRKIGMAVNSFNSTAAVS